MKLDDLEKKASGIRKRNKLLAEGIRIHDEQGCSCDRKYIMSCPNLAAAILSLGDKK